MTLHQSGKTGRILKIVGIVLLVVFAIAAIGVYVATRALNVDNVRTFLQTQSRERIGRELTVEGELRLRIFSLQPRIQADDVRLGNATWGSQRDMVHVKRLEAEIDLLALIAGTIKIDRFNLLQPEVLIETDRQGRGNWASDQRESPPAAAGPGIGSPPFALDVREVRVVNGRLTFRSGVTGREHRVDLARLIIRSRSTADPLSIDLAGSVNGRPFTVVGSVGSLIDLPVRRQPLPLQLTVQAGDARGSLTGTVAQPFELAGIDVRVAAEGKELAEVMRYFGVNAPALGRYRLSGRLSGSTDSLAARDVVLVVNDGRATLTGAVAQLYDMAGIDARVVAEGDELAEVMRYFGVNAPALGRYRLTGRLSGSADSLAARDVVLVVNDGRATLTGAVARLLEMAGIDVRVAAEGDEFAEVMRYFGVNVPALGRYRLSGRLSGSARSLAANDVKLLVGNPERTGARLQGEFRDVLGLAGAEFEVSARVADLKNYVNVTWLTAPTLPALKLHGRVTQSRDAYVIRNLAVSLGHSSLSGTASVSPHTPRWNFTAQLAGPLIDLHELAPRPAAGAQSQPPPKEGEKLFSAEPLSLGWLDAVDLDLKLQAERLVRKVGQELYAVNAHVVLADGKFSLDPLLIKLSPDDNALAVRLRAHAASTGKVDVSASVQGAAIKLANLLALMGRPKSVSGAPTDVMLKFHATGGSVRELMAGLNGEARMIVGAGQLDERAIETGADLLTRFFSLAYPFAKEKSYTALECAVVRLPVRDGIVTVNRSIALQTEKVSIAASGIIDLRRETIELLARTHAREGLGLGTGKLTNMYQIQGALGAPSLGLSGKGALSTGMSTGAAVGTAGISLLVERLLLTDRHPCRTALGTPPEAN